MKDYTDAAYEAAMQVLYGPRGVMLDQAVETRTAREMAAIIDKATLLPEKHAALLLAQGVVDAAEQCFGGMKAVKGSVLEQIHLLRTALAKIR